jgi:hypothetical protein
MLGRIRLAAICLIALTAAAGCDPAAQPTGPTAAITVPVASQINDTECRGVITGVHHNVVVPPGALCQIIDAIVLANVKALQGSDVVMRNVDVRGSVEGDRGDNINAENVQVGGTLAVRGGRVTILNFVTVKGGDLEVTGSTGPNSAVAVEDTEVWAGNVQLIENESQTVRLRRVTTRESIRVLRNRGPGTKQIHFNVAQSIQCFDNDLPFEGGPNTAPSIEGQCF